MRLRRMEGEAISMARRLNTIIIVPHNKAKFHKVSFTTRTLALACGGIALVLALSVVAIVFSGTAVSRTAEVDRLADENRQLVAINDELEKTVADVQAQLDEFEQRTARLALAAGMDTGMLDGSVGDGVGEQAGRGGPYSRLLEGPEQLGVQSRWVAASLDRLEDHLQDQTQRYASTPTVAPVKGVITDGFGRRRDPFTGRWAFHQGLDLSARRGTPVIATADGIVVFTGRDGGLGRVVRISHGFGYTTVFGHLDRVSVELGDEIHRGDEIGLLGSSGRSTGPHLHYEVHVDGKAVDPLSHILDAY